MAAVKSHGISLYSLTSDLDLLVNLLSTSELAFGLMLGLCRSIVNCHTDVVSNSNWDYTQFMGK